MYICSQYTPRLKKKCEKTRENSPIYMRIRVLQYLGFWRYFDTQAIPRWYDDAIRCVFCSLNLGILAFYRICCQTSQVKVTAHDLRTKGQKELLKQLDELKNELSQLRVAKVTGSGASKLAKIHVGIYMSTSLMTRLHS